MNALDKPVVAVDIGGTKFITAVIGTNGKILSRVYCLTLSHEGPEKIIGRLITAIKNSIEKSGLESRELSGIGVAAAGIVDIRRGLITEAPNLPNWHNVPLRDRLANEFDMPTFIINDASAAALGEYSLGASNGLNNLIYMTVSTGIGGGIIINGELYEGTDGCAAEVGHMIIQAGGPLCSCGRHGCLEALASGTAIARMAKELLQKGERSILTEMMNSTGTDITAETVVVAARRGDALASRVIGMSAWYLGIGLANLVDIFNPQMIIIGGGVSGAGEMLLRPARKSMKEHAFRLPSKTVRIVRSKLGTNAGLLGAALYERSRLRG